MDEADVRRVTEASASTANKDRVKREAVELVETGGCVALSARPTLPSALAHRAFGFPWLVVEKGSEKASFFGSEWVLSIAV
jgi:hypothetical protein